MKMSALPTRSTKPTRRSSDTELPRMNTSRMDAGIPPSDVRARARWTWSVQAVRTASACWVITTYRGGAHRPYHPRSDGGHDVASRRLPDSVGIAYRTRSRSGLTISVIDGEVTEDDFRELARRQGEDAEWHASTCSLTDARTALTPSVDPESLGAFAAQYAQMRATDRPCEPRLSPGTIRSWRLATASCARTNRPARWCSTTWRVRACGLTSISKLYAARSPRCARSCSRGAASHVALARRRGRRCERVRSLLTS